MWQDNFREIIVERGYEYFYDGRFEIIDLTDNLISANVHGSQIYLVTINFKLNEITSMSCNCPYAKKDNCKHMATLFICLDYLIMISDNKKLIADIPKFKRELLNTFITQLINEDPSVGVKFIEYLNGLKIN